MEYLTEKEISDLHVRGEVIDLKKAGARFGYDPNTLRLLVRKGRIRAVKVNRRNGTVYVFPSSVKEYSESLMSGRPDAVFDELKARVAILEEQVAKLLAVKSHGDEEWVTAKVAAAQFNYNYSTLLRLLAKGKIPSRIDSHGRRQFYLVKIADVKAYISKVAVRHD